VRARELLGWEAAIGIERGFKMLTEAFRNCAPALAVADADISRVALGA
jgi:hypothetical protein